MNAKPERTSGLDDHTGYWLNRLRAEVHAAFEQALERHDVTVAQWNVLITLYRGAAAGSAMTPQSVAQAIGIDTGAVTRLVDRLVDKGLTARTTDPQDRRSIMLTLTRKGRALAPQLAAVADRNDAAFFGALSADEHRQLKHLIGKLLTARGVDVSARWRSR